MQKEVPIAAAAGLAASVLHLSGEWSLLGALIFALAAPLPLLAAGLSFGLGTAALASAVAMVTIGAVSGFARTGLFAAGSVVPVLIVIRFGLLNRSADDESIEWYPPGLVLTWLTLYCAAAFAVLAVALGSGPQGLEAGIASYVDGFRQMVAGARDSAAVDRMLATLKRVFPFLVVTWWVIVITVNAHVAQKILVRTGNAKRPSPDLTTTALPPWILPAVVAAAAVALVGSGWLGFVATNIALILCIPYFLSGLAILHAISARWNGRKAILIAVYLLLLLFGWPLIVVTGLGMMEYWVDLRQRFAAPGQSNERNE
ncbi:MAG: hypothetical protein ACI82H_001279 [Alphaproteobacteria bacterium]|jgi:hypothetical protein